MPRKAKSEYRTEFGSSIADSHRRKPADDSITAAKLRLIGFEDFVYRDRGNIYRIYDKRKCMSNIYLDAKNVVSIGNCGEYSIPIRTVTGWSDLCELVRVLRG